MNTYSTTLTIVDKHLPGEAPLKHEVRGATGFDAAHAIGKAIDELQRDGFTVTDIGPVATEDNTLNINGEWVTFNTCPTLGIVCWFRGIHYSFTSITEGVAWLEKNDIDG